MGITLKNNKQVTKNMTIKGDDGVGIKTITSGTPVVTEEKTTTPITVTLTDETTQNFNVEAKNGSGADNALTKPTTAPSTTQIVAVDNTNTQTMLSVGDGLSVENGSLKASGGTGTKKYFHQILLTNNDLSVLIGLFTVSNIENYATGEPASVLNSSMPDNMIYECCKDTNAGTLEELVFKAEYRSFGGFFIKTVNLTTHEITELHFELADLQIYKDSVVEL